MTVVKFPILATPRIESATGTVEQSTDFRSRDMVDRDVREHTAARRAYAQAVVWAVAAEDSNLPPAQIEEARSTVGAAFEEMNFRGRCLINAVPTDLRGLVDLLMYLEKNFSLLPQDMGGKSLALKLLQITRLSLRKVASYGKGK